MKFSPFPPYNTPIDWTLNTRISYPLSPSCHILTIAFSKCHPIPFPVHAVSSGTLGPTLYHYNSSSNRYRHTVPAVGVVGTTYIIISPHFSTSLYAEVMCSLFDLQNYPNNNPGPHLFKTILDGPLWVPFLHTYKKPQTLQLKQLKSLRNRTLKAADMNWISVIWHFVCLE